MYGRIAYALIMACRMFVFAKYQTNVGLALVRA